MKEKAFIDLLKQMPLHDGARGLNDDAAVVTLGDKNLVFTKDMMAQGVHYFSNADPADVAWKLLAVNLSDLAAKGAKPIGVMLGFTLGDNDWDCAFADGLQCALEHFDVTLLGGDTIASKERILSLTALGFSDGAVPSRSGAKNGDIIYISGPVGDAYTGYEMVKSANVGKCHTCLLAYNRPEPLLELGQSLAPKVNAMMDISDGLLLDMMRMALASSLMADLTLEAHIVSEQYQQNYGSESDAILSALTWGDDYQLLCAADPMVRLPDTMIAIGKFIEGEGIAVQYENQRLEMPKNLGFVH